MSNRWEFGDDDDDDDSCTACYCSVECTYPSEEKSFTRYKNVQQQQ